MEDWGKRSRDLLFNSGIPQYFRSGKSYKLSKVVNGDDGNLRAETPSWSRGLAHSGKGRGRKFGGGGFAPKLNIAYLSVNSACNFVQECSEDAKNQSACYISPSSSPLPAWGQLQKCGIEWAVIVLRALIMIAATGETVYTSLKYGHVDYTICILNIISVKNSKYQL